MDRGLELDVSDAGSPFEESRGPTADDPLAEHGRGLALVRSVGELTYRREDGRNHWHLAAPRSA